MKNYIKYYIFLLNVIIFTCKSTIVTGDWTSEKQNNIRTDYSKTHYYAEKCKYIKGGITINYPSKYFSSAPIVYLSITLNKLKYSSDLKISSFTTSSTAENVTIRVNKQTSGIFSTYVDEAADDDIFIEIFAIGS